MVIVHPVIQVYSLVSRLADLIFSSSYPFGRFTEIVPIGVLCSRSECNQNFIPTVDQEI